MLGPDWLVHNRIWWYSDGWNTLMQTTLHD